MTTIEKPYDLVKQYMASLNDHDCQVIKELHAVKMRAYRKKCVKKISVGRPALDPEVKRENIKKIRQKYRERIKQAKIDNGTYRPPGRPKKVVEKVVEKVEEKVEK
jgi:hypothetical protein